MAYVEVKRGHHQWIETAPPPRNRDGGGWTGGIGQVLRVDRAGVTRGASAPAPAPRRATPAAPVAPEPVLLELVDDLALPLLRAAITGTAEQVRLAAGLVRTHVETHGPNAARELQATAQQVNDPALVVNLARAGAALERCPGETLARIRVDATRSAGQAPVRRPRRRR